MNIQLLPHETTRPPDAVPETPVFRLTVDEYHAIQSSGAFGDKYPLELLEGFLVSKMGEGPLHHCLLEALRRIVERQLPAGLHVRTDGPLSLQSSEPEPDLAVVRGEFWDYRERHPAAVEAPVVIEIADSSLQRDLGWKKRIYAAEAVACYCVVDVPARRIVVHSQLDRSETPARYSSIIEYSEGETAELPCDKSQIAVNHAELFDGRRS